MTPSEEEVVAFIASSFRSVWALELLLLLKREARPCRPDELVSMMRASPSIIGDAVDALVAAGLADSSSGCARYMPSSTQVASLVDETEQLYRSRPNRVRRLIVTSAHKGLTAFSDAFRLKD